MANDFEVDYTETKNSFIGLNTKDKTNSSSKQQPENNNSNTKSDSKTEPKVEPETEITEVVETYGKLEPWKEFCALLIINVYEYFLGLTLGFILNEIFFRIIKFDKSKSENLAVSFLLLTIMVTLVISICLMARKSSSILPFVSTVYKHPDFKHPPPIALTFSLWRTLTQVKKRSKYVQEAIFRIIN